ncbi:MAG: cupin domain-containing protein [Pseudomonadota bacterium]
MTKTSAPTKVNLDTAFAKIDQPWQPHIAGEINGIQVKLAKFDGEFIWHHHAHEDEMFLVVKGRLLMKLRDGDIELHPGEFLVVPHGVEHCPVGHDDCQVLMVEPASTLNTGNVENTRTVRDLKKIE